VHRLDQHILRRLRLLIACLLVAVAVEPASAHFTTCTPAQIVAIAEARSAGVPRVSPATARVSACLATEPTAAKICSDVARERAYVEPTPDGRHLYLTDCALLC